MLVNQKRVVSKGVNLVSPSEANWDGWNRKRSLRTLNVQLDGLRGQVRPAFNNQPGPLANANMLKFYRSGDYMTPRQVLRDARVAWFDDKDNSYVAYGAPGAPAKPGGVDDVQLRWRRAAKKESFESGDVGQLGEAVTDKSEISDAAAIGAAMQWLLWVCHHVSFDKYGQPDLNLESGDYNSYVRSLVADHRMLANHASWVKEVQPFSRVL